MFDVLSTDDSSTEKAEIQAIHPTALIRRACVCLLGNLTIAAGLHSSTAHRASIKTVSGMLHKLVDAGTSGRARPGESYGAMLLDIPLYSCVFPCIPCIPLNSPKLESVLPIRISEAVAGDVCAQQHRDWAKLGFVRGIAATPTMCYNLSSPRWVALLLRVVSGSLPEDDTQPAVSAVHLPRQARIWSIVHVMPTCW